MSAAVAVSARHTMAAVATPQVWGAYVDIPLNIYYYMGMKQRNLTISGFGPSEGLDSAITRTSIRSAG